MKNLVFAVWGVTWLGAVFLLVNLAYLFATALHEAIFGEGDLILVPAYGYLLVLIAYISSATPRFR